MEGSLIGKRFGRLEIISEPFNKKYGGKNCKFVVCKCICGKEKEVYIYSILKHKTKSCGCISIEVAKKNNTKHNIYNHPIYRIWQGIKDRCVVSYKTLWSRLYNNWSPEKAITQPIGDK